MEGVNELVLLWEAPFKRRRVVSQGFFSIVFLHYRNSLVPSVGNTGMD
jgi:hypothetical protein